MIAALEAMKFCWKTTQAQKNNLFCFGHDEEFTGKEGEKHSSPEKNNIQMEFVLDEGGTVLDGSIIGVKGMLALIGTCEKGYVDIQLKAKAGRTCFHAL